MFNSKINGLSKTAGNTLKVAILAATLMSGGQAIAASACKGLDNKSCDAKANCGWVNGYERKDGKKVSSFCRTKATTKATTKAKTKATAKAKSAG